MSLHNWTVLSDFSIVIYSQNLSISWLTNDNITCIGFHHNANVTQFDELTCSCI